MHRSDTLRLFVALYPPTEHAEALLSRLNRLVLPEHRSTPTAQVHMTLVFIGDRRVKELRAVRESIDRSASGLPPFTVTPQRLITIPTPAQGGPPRLVAAATDSPPTLLELQRRLASRLARPDERKRNFHPHITLARFAQGVSAAAVDQAIDGAAFGIDVVRLMASTLTRSGALHEMVGESRLTG